jgi:uncharacterized protein
MQTERRQVLWLGLGFEGGLGLLAGFVGWLAGQPPWQTMHWNLTDLAIGLAASVPMLLVYVVCVHWPVGPLARIKQFSEGVVRPLFASSTWAEVAVIALLAGVGEELLFRGLLQDLFCRWWGYGIGVAAASVLFGLTHPITIAYVVLAGLMGAYLGLVWLATGNLLVPIVAHAMYDFLALMLLVRRAPQASRGP